MTEQDSPSDYVPDATQEDLLCDNCRARMCAGWLHRDPVNVSRRMLRRQMGAALPDE